MGCRTDKHLFIFVELRVLSRVWILQCIHFTHNLTLLIVDLYFMHCWSSLRILVYICIETDFWLYRSAAHLDSTVIYDGCDLGDSRIRPDQCASRRPEESAGAHFGSGHSLPHFDTILCSYTILCNFTSFPTGCHSCYFLLSSYVQLPLQLNSRSSGESADRGSSGFDVARRTHQRGHRSGATSKPSQRQCVDSGPWGPIKCQSPGFCRFSLHVPGFIRFLLDWIGLNWIELDWLGFLRHERKKTRSESVRIVTVRDDFCQN